jgi:hypothetical protein
VEDERITVASNLSESDREILSLLGRKKTMVDIAFETGMPEFRVACRMLELHDQRLIHVNEVPDGVSYEQQVEALQRLVREGVAFYNATKYREARASFQKALQIDPQHKYARLFVEKLKNAKEYRKPVTRISLDTIPVLRISTDELTSMALDAQEGFVLSRVNGEWDLGAIVKLCPMTEQEVLFIVRRLLDDGVIELKERAPGAGRESRGKLSWGSARPPNQEI